ncbi:MAG: hypothetical protein RLZZ387_2594 [Chloroflexota bacterium]|jgi:hypothetical protein
MSDYIQDTVNGYLARITDAPIRIEWDGQPVSRDDPAHFNVHVYGEPTSFYAVDYPTGLSLFEGHGPHNCVDEIDTVRSYVKLAELIAEVVPVEQGEEA